MKHLVALFVLTWGLLRGLWMSIQRQAGDIGLPPEAQPGARKTYLVQEILEELRAQGINLPPEWETKIRTAVTQQQLQKFELASQSYAVLEKAQLKPDQPAINLLALSKKLKHNFALLQDALKIKPK